MERGANALGVLTRSLHCGVEVSVWNDRHVTSHNCGDLCYENVKAWLLVCGPCTAGSAICSGWGANEERESHHLLRCSVIAPTVTEAAAARGNQNCL